MPTKFNERVAVLLPLYNPEPYLFDQLESLASQDIEKFDLIWGVSKDENNSIPAIDAMCAFTNNYFVDINGLSASNAFFKLLSKAAEYDYVAFCDQDDIWEKSKLSKQVASLKQFENSVALSHSNFTILNDKNFNVVDNCYSHKVDTLLEGNCARGCTMVLNKKLVRTILESPVERMIWHDWWTILIASAYGVIVKNVEPLTKYRLHERNLVGIPGIRRRLINFIHRKKGTSLNMGLALLTMADELGVLPPQELIHWIKIYEKRGFNRILGTLFSPRKRKKILDDLIRRVAFCVKIP